jgi:hypothetical protein
MNIGFFFMSLKEYDAHIAPFIKNSPRQDFKHFIFHLNNINTPKYENDDIRCHSIDLSTKLNIKNNLKDFNLDFMVFNSPGHIYSIFLINICKQLSIIPLYFQHGLSLDFTSFDLKSLSQDKSINRKLVSIKKYLFFYSTFGINLLFIRKRMIVLKNILIKSSYLVTRLFWKSAMHKLPKYGLKDVHCDYAFVYGNNDKKYLVESMNMSPNRIVVSGYPFIAPTKDRFFMKEKNQILYLTPAFRATGILPISIDDEREFYLTLYKQVRLAGCKLSIKVHPMDDFDLIKSYFVGVDNVSIYKNKNLADLTLAASVVISDFSTALFYAIKYYKPIIILISEYFKNYPFDYTKHGIGIKAKLDDLSKVIKDAININLEKDSSYRRFLDHFLFDNSDQNAYLKFYSTIEGIQTKDREKSVI